MPVQRDTTCGDFFGRHHLLHHRAAVCRPAFGVAELLFELRNDAVGHLAGALEFALALGDRQFVAGIIELLLELGGEAELLLFRLPAGRSASASSSSPASSISSCFEPVLRRLVGFLLQRLALDLQLHDAAIEFVELFRLGIHLHAQPRAASSIRSIALSGRKRSVM